MAIPGASFPSTSASTTLFLNYFDGSAGSQVLVDEVSGISWTAYGSAALDDSQQFSGPTSLLLPPGIATPERAIVSGYQSPHLKDFIYGGRVRWDGDWNLANGTSIRLRAVDVSGLGIIGINLFGLGANASFSRSVTANNGTAGFPISADKFQANEWHEWGIIRNGPEYYVYWDGTEVFHETEPTDTYAQAQFEIDNLLSSVNVWVDDTYLIADFAVTYDVVVDDAEFDWETSSPVLGNTLFLDRANPFHCRRVVVPECPRRLRAKGACRLIIAKPSVLH